MATGKKRGIKRTKITPKGFFITILFMGSIIASGIFFYYLYHSISKTSYGAYEEFASRSPDLKKKINKIDHVIYESLYKGGIEEEDVYFSEVTTGKSKEYEWDFTELSIKIPDKDTAFRLGGIINNELSNLKPDIVIDGEDIPGNEVAYDIFILGLYTHRIRLIYKEGWKEPYGDLPKIAIVIDDIGNDYELASSFIDIGLPLTLSILPSSVHGKEIVEKARAKGIEVLLHLPMEPKNYPDIDPGPDALLTKMNEDEIKAVLDKNLKKVKGIVGVNNHMGSYFTEREDKMTYVLRELKKRNFFYLDSRTTSNSVGFKLAGEIGVPSAEKDVFLDNDLSSKAIKYQMDRLIGIARYSGEAIGIGHPHEMTLDVLREYAGVLKADFKVVPVSELVR